MTSIAALNATKHRADYSRCIVHLTRDDRGTFPNGASARDNLLQILRLKNLWAVRPHCIYSAKIKTLPKEQREKFNVICFTEVPLSQLHLLVQDIPGRQVKLEPYGLVFTKDFIVRNGGQPAIYVNSYSGVTRVREAVDYLYDLATKSDDHEMLRRIIPFVNAMHEKYDFTWEREWRLARQLRFTLDDLVCLILPEDKEDDIREKALKAGVPVISPGWTYEQIITELAKQQKKTKNLFGATVATKDKGEEA